MLEECAKRKMKEGKEVLGRTAVVARGAKESLPEEGTSEQRLEGGEGQSHGDISGCAFRERGQQMQRPRGVPEMLAD